MDRTAKTDENIELAYGFGRTVDMPFERARERVRECLKAEGFGVLCEIDIKEKLEEKLGVDFRKYVILGACNPPLAHRTLQTELGIGLLLPCNVVVYEQGASSVVAAIDAAKILSIVGNPAVEATASEVTAKLRRVVDAV